MTANPSPAAFAAPANGRAPMTHGVSLDGAFFSLDSQAGRPAVLALVGRAPLSGARDALAALQARAAAFAAIEADCVALVDLESPFVGDFVQTCCPQVRIVFSRADVFRDWGFGSGAPALVALDRAGRVLPAPVAPTQATLDALLASLSGLPREPPRTDLCPAPVLAIPNILSPDLCLELISHFEASAHVFGGMASLDAAGQFMHKVDPGKKHRSDFVLGPRDPFLNRVMQAIVARCLPEIRKAFQVEVQHTDRILLARYDDSGGYFKRHRDNSAPSVAFRQFALSLNLNDDYWGGEVLFPEYNDRRYRPPAGAGVVFSCSLLHEAAAVTQGRRYCALTFLHDAAAQARWLAASRAA